MGQESNIFLVDHAFSFHLSDAPKQLQEVPGLVERMASLMCVDIDLNSDVEDTDNDGCESNNNKLGVMEIVEREVQKVKKEGAEAVMWLELEDLDIDDDLFPSLDLPNKFPGLIALSLCDNKLKSPETIINPILQNFDDSVAEVVILIARVLKF
ncbi:hypothetical protein HanOQP8_Chr02g0070721 [Helianthus annuus]|nr:hypothetical protein HanOQP8_Chr02g0070721 [Helianthus annuus]